MATIVVALLAGCGDAPPAGLKVEDLTVASRAVQEDMAVKVVVPEGGAARRPLLVFLHGRGGDEGSYCRTRCCTQSRRSETARRSSPSRTAPRTSTGTTATAATGAAT